jgi:CheY-like chemotaxis protein
LTARGDNAAAYLMLRLKNYSAIPDNGGCLSKAIFLVALSLDCSLSRIVQAPVHNADRTLVTEPITPQPGVAGQGLPGRGETLLIVDDDDSIRDCVCRTLARQGYQTIGAQSGEEAVELWRTHSELVRVVVTDFLLPGLNGVELVRQIKNTNKEVRILFLSGHNRNAIKPDYIDSSIAFLHKPFLMSELVGALGALLDSAPKANSAS